MQIDEIVVYLQPEPMNLRTCEPYISYMVLVFSGYRLPATGYRFEKVLKVLRFLVWDLHPLSSIVPSIPGLRPAPSPRGYALVGLRFRVFLATGHWLQATIIF